MCGVGGRLGAPGAALGSILDNSWIDETPTKALAVRVSGCRTPCSLHGVNEERLPRAQLQGKAQLSRELKWIIPLKWIYSLCRCRYPSC